MEEISTLRTGLDHWMDLTEFHGAVKIHRHNGEFLEGGVLGVCLF